MPTPIVLTAEQFNDLQGQMLPVDKLPISDDQKAAIKEEASKIKTAGAASPNVDPIPLVICRMVGDEVVCRVIRPR